MTGITTVMITTGVTVSPLCMGITTPLPPDFDNDAAYANHHVVGIPGGHTVIGSGEFDDAQPRWVSLSPYLIGGDAVSEEEYRNVMGRPGTEGAYKRHPVTMVSHDDAIEYLKRVEERRGRQEGLTLPTEAQWENAARGPAVNIPKLMEEEEGRYYTAGVADFVEGRFENLVFSVLGHIFTDPKAELFQKLISEGRPFFGWRVYGTPSGRLSHGEAWFGQERISPVSLSPEISGPANAYGLFNMTGNVWEWVQDWYSENAYMLDGVHPIGPDEDHFRVLRGGSWFDDSPVPLRAAYRGSRPPDSPFDGGGFRVAVPNAAID